MAKLLLFCLAWLFSFVSSFSHFSLKLFFGTQRRPRRLKFFYRQEAGGRLGGGAGGLSWKGPIGSYPVTGCPLGGKITPNWESLNYTVVYVIVRSLVTSTKRKRNTLAKEIGRQLIKYMQLRYKLRNVVRELVQTENLFKPMNEGG